MNWLDDVGYGVSVDTDRALPIIKMLNSLGRRCNNHPLVFQDKPGTEDINVLYPFHYIDLLVRAN